MEIAFSKMNGAGNEFVVIDSRHQELGYLLREQDIVHICSDKNKQTKGCDQLILLEASEEADCFMRIYNADGSEVDACGNATRCVAWLISRDMIDIDDVPENLSWFVTIKTNAGILSASGDEGTEVMVDMGRPRTEWNEIPLAEKCDTLHVELGNGLLKDCVAVNMGNPHAVFFVEDPEVIPLDIDGPAIEKDPMFPDRVNVSIASVSSQVIFLRVWERGAGETQACGTAACAAFVAAGLRGLLNTEENVRVVLPGGVLELGYDDLGHVLMRGPTEHEFSNTFTLR